METGAEVRAGGAGGRGDLELAGGRVPRVVVVVRRTDYEEVIRRHATRQLAAFFLERRGQSIDALENRHLRFHAALQAVSADIPLAWRRTRVDRGDLDRFLFEPGDIIVALGQDGLVANVAKYLAGQPVIGLNPEPDRNPGVLVPHPPEAAADLLADAAAGRAKVQERTMVEATLTDGRRLVALNEIFVGHRSHQSARYRLRWGSTEERHSSSGLIVATGTGATGWARSIHLSRSSPLPLPTPEKRTLAFFVREAWPSALTGTDLTEGILKEGETLEVTSEMNEGGVLFGDGIEGDHIELNWGRRARLRRAPACLHLVAPAE